MTDDRLDRMMGIAESALDRHPGLEMEVFLLEDTVTSVGIEKDSLKGASEVRSLGLSVRVLHDGHVGFAYSHDEGGLADVVQRAREQARHTPRVPIDPFAASQTIPEIVGIHHNVQQRRTNVVFGPRWHRLWGKGRLRERVGRLILAASPPSFLQVNTRASEAMYDLAREFLSEGSFRPRLLLDLYSGIGSIALYLADLADHVAGIEVNRRAVEDANLNAEINKVENVRFIHGKAEHILPRLDIQRPAPWAAVLDPPRMGCEPAVLDYLDRSEVRRAVYISCDPASFARDAGLLAGKGWKLDRVQPIDLFPQTSHVEIVARLVR